MSYRRDEIVYDPEDDEWLPIPEHDGYFVSKTGHIFGPGRHGEPWLIRPTSGKHGHQYVSLYQDGKRTKQYVHRLVAENFIPNREKLPLVRHLNGDPTDNNVENLAWGTQVDNMRDAIELGTFRHFSENDRKKAVDARRTPIKAVRVDTQEEFHFPSQQEAKRQLGVCQSDINGILKGRRRAAKGWKFEYEEDRDG